MTQRPSAGESGSGIEVLYTESPNGQGRSLIHRAGQLTEEWSMEIELNKTMSRSWDEDGYFIVRGVLTPEQAREIRGVILDKILSFTDTPTGHEVDPAGMQGQSMEARISRARKLDKLGWQSPLIWHSIHASRRMTGFVRQFLGEDILVKFAACFLKPPRNGSGTPWHQDNGLWRDGELGNFNFWMAIDPATQENGCMQMVPGTHTWPILEHVQYDGGIHPEIPRDHIAETLAKHEVRHIELEPGDMVCWQSSLYHCSPPNYSNKSRIAVAGVYSSLEIANVSSRFKEYRWALQGGNLVESWPPRIHHSASGNVTETPVSSQAQLATTF